MCPAILPEDRAQVKLYPAAAVNGAALNTLANGLCAALMNPPFTEKILSLH